MKVAFVRLTEKVDDDNGVVCVALRLFVVVARLIEEECGHVGREDGGVDDEDEDDPVPERLEGRVVQHGPLVDAGRLQLVLGHHLGAQRQHLRGRERKKIVY